MKTHISKKNCHSVRPSNLLEIFGGGHQHDPGGEGAVAEVEDCEPLRVDPGLRVRRGQVPLLKVNLHHAGCYAVALFVF